MKKWTAGIVTGMLSGVLLSLLFVRPYESRIPLSELILQLSGSTGVFVITPSALSLIGLFIRLVPDCVFMMLYGVFIYRHYCTAGVYIFSRVLNRRGWFYRESIRLGMIVLAYVLIQTAVVWGTSAIRYEVAVDQAGLCLMACWIVTNGLWTFFWTLLVNCVAIWTGGSEKGAAVAFGLHAIAYGIIGTLDFCQSTLHWITEEEMSRLLPFSLLSHMVAGWHRASAPLLGGILSGLMETTLTESLILLAVMSLILVLVTGSRIQRMDILGVNTEGK